MLVFFTIFCIGISVYKDYGVSIDDQIYLTNGQYYYQYIKSLFTEVDKEYLENLKALNEQLGGADIINQIERPLLRVVLSQTNWNQLRAAKILGINRNTLRKKIEILNIKNLNN